MDLFSAKRQPFPKSL